MKTRTSVPCNGCRLCCINDVIVLHPEHGDRIEDYQTVSIRNPLTGAPAHMIDHKPNGECIYLGTTGCTIYGNAPKICRDFDCRRMYLRIPRQQRKAMIRACQLSKDKFDAGRERIASLSVDEMAEITEMNRVKPFAMRI